MKAEESKKKYCRATRWDSAERPLLVHHVAERIGCENRMVRHLAQTGLLHGFKLGDGRKIGEFRRADRERFLGVHDER